MVGMEESSEEILICIIIRKFRKRTSRQAFYKQVLWSDEVLIDLSGYNEQRYVWGTKDTEFGEKNTCTTVLPWSSVSWT